MTLSAPTAPAGPSEAAPDATSGQEPESKAAGPAPGSAAASHPSNDQGPPVADGGNVGRQDTTHAAVYLTIALILVALAAVGGGISLIVAHANSGLASAAFVASVFAVVATVVVPLGVKRETRLEKEDAAARDADCEDLQHALLHGRAPGVPEVLKRMTLANFRQVRSFMVIAQRQARMSYYASLIGAGMSLLVLLAGSAVAIGEPGLTGKITAGSLAVLGTAISTFLSKTFLRTYDMSLRQMSYYYGQPLVHCYLYLAEWQTLLAPVEVGDQAKQELYQEVVRASLRASAHAQHHLLSLHEHDLPGRRGSVRQLMSPPGVAQPHPAAAALCELLTVMPQC